MSHRQPEVGDEALLYLEGCLPNRVIVTAVKDGAITRVRCAAIGTGSWLAYGPDQFEVEGAEPADWAGHMVLYPAQPLE